MSNFRKMRVACQGIFFGESPRKDKNQGKENLLYCQIECGKKNLRLFGEIEIRYGPKGIL